MQGTFGEKLWLISGTRHSSVEDVSTQTTLGRSHGCCSHSEGRQASFVQSARCYMDQYRVQCSDVSLPQSKSNQIIFISGNTRRTDIQRKNSIKSLQVC